MCWNGPRPGPGASFRGCGKASVDDAPDLGAAGAAIGSRVHRLADGFDAVAAAAHRGDDLVDADAEAGTDDGAGIWRIGPRTAGDEREAQIGRASGRERVCQYV